MTEQSLLEEEIESRKWFSNVMRKDDRALWEAMVQESRESFGEAVEKSGKPLTVDPFFMCSSSCNREQSGCSKLNWTPMARLRQ